MTALLNGITEANLEPAAHTCTAAAFRGQSSYLPTLEKTWKGGLFILATNQQSSQVPPLPRTSVVKLQPSCGQMHVLNLASPEISNVDHCGRNLPLTRNHKQRRAFPLSSTSMKIEHACHFRNMQQSVGYIKLQSG
jgi:hypothetical protein